MFGSSSYVYSYENKTSLYSINDSGVVHLKYWYKQLKHTNPRTAFWGPFGPQTMLIVDTFVIGLIKK